MLREKNYSYVLAIKNPGLQLSMLGFQSDFKVLIVGVALTCNQALFLFQAGKATIFMSALC